MFAERMSSGKSFVAISLIKFLLKLNALVAAAIFKDFSTTAFEDLFSKLAATYSEAK
ncbi:MAG TPA: hypothetical protein VFW07_15185 [Parafilimonas sp.]|nr:hypothetical protein [Parafilimonas sp.]